MEDYDREFLTFTVKDEPFDSEDEFIGFEDNVPSYADVYKQYIVLESVKEEFQQKDAKVPEAPKERIKRPSQAKVYPAAKKLKPTGKIKIEPQKRDPIKEQQQGQTDRKSQEFEVQTDFKITLIGRLLRLKFK